MVESSSEYYRRRAEEEESASLTASTAEGRRLHGELANRYRALSHEMAGNVIALRV